ncbi:hypothetical protein CC80DRAFT_538639 [Byssothecium circinans]|uniref:SH3 domain-containing protein n=1 Tax=Byssothecium circinans TaxID=147558 RepID=A0A6A5TID6_9PLEO|nr:hypothetical protein CC80DRAFT_538639 [Byssothecium circinans]
MASSWRRIQTMVMVLPLPTVIFSAHGIRPVRQDQLMQPELKAHLDDIRLHQILRLSEAAFVTRRTGPHDRYAHGVTRIVEPFTTTAKGSMRRISSTRPQKEDLMKKPIRINMYRLSSTRNSDLFGIQKRDIIILSTQGDPWFQRLQLKERLDIPSAIGFAQQFSMRKLVQGSTLGLTGSITSMHQPVKCKRSTATILPQTCNTCAPASRYWERANFKAYNSTKVRRVIGPG